MDSSLGPRAESSQLIDIQQAIEDRFSDRAFFQLIKDDNGSYLWRDVSPATDWLRRAGIVSDAEVSPRVFHGDRQELLRLIESVCSGSRDKERTSIRLYLDGGGVMSAHLGLAKDGDKVIGYVEPVDADEVLAPNHRLREILNQTAVSYTLLDSDYTILDFNERSDQYAQKVFGRPMRRGDSIFSFTTDELVGLLTRDLTKAFNGEEVRYEWEYEHDGVQYYFYFIYVPFKERDGVVREVAMLTLDLSEGRQLEQSNRELIAAIEKSPVSIVITKSDGTIRYVNTFFEELTGYTAQEVVGKNPRILQSGSTSPEAYADLWEKLLAGEPWYGEFYNQKKSGREYHESAILLPLFDSSGQLSSVVGIKEDITEQKRTVDKLKASQERFYRLFNNAGDAIYVHDTSGSIREVNDAACRQTGYSKAELEAMRIGDVDVASGPEPPPEVVEALGAGNEAAAQSAHARFESLHRRKDGTTFPVSVVLFLFDTAEETLIAASVADITEAKQKEAQIVASLEEKEVLLRELHHRVKNNFQLMASLVRLQEESISDKDDREVFKKNEDRIRAMAMVHQMLHQSESASTIDLSDYLRELATYTSQESNNGGVPVDIVVDSESVQLEIDRAAPFALAVHELISNAAKYCCSSGQRGRVELSLRRDGAEIEMRISDSGDGDATEFFKEYKRGFGTQLVNLLADQMNAVVTTFPGPGGRIRLRLLDG
jgi:PAS domain S-box-containing protein